MFFEDPADTWSGSYLLPCLQKRKKTRRVVNHIFRFFAPVALIPTNSNSADSCAMFHLTDSPLRNAIHLSCAGLMLGIFSYMSIFLFTRSNPANYNAQNPAPGKVRNFIYVFCGLLTFLSIVTIILYREQFEKRPVSIRAQVHFLFEG